MLKIWGRLSSINVQKVVWCASELGCRFERIDAGGAFGVVQTPGFQRLNPNRKVPVIEDDGLVLWESNAIVRYLCARYPDAGLCPDSPAARAQCDMWMDWQATELTPAMRDAFLQLVRTAPQERDAAVVEASARQTESMMAILDDTLRDRPFVAGDRFTMADIPVACGVHRWFGLPRQHIARAHVDKWYQAVSRRGAARTVLVLPLA
ncbi:MAG: glutathione S-transferase family protein [Lautropia sp.]|nr:glutathione S-transferase family protein [Lautropia sp.]